MYSRAAFRKTKGYVRTFAPLAPVGDSAKNAHAGIWHESVCSHCGYHVCRDTGGRHQKDVVAGVQPPAPSLHSDDEFRRTFPGLASWLPEPAVGYAATRFELVCRAGSAPTPLRIGDLVRVYTPWFGKGASRTEAVIGFLENGDGTAVVLGGGWTVTEKYALKNLVKKT